MTPLIGKRAVSYTHLDVYKRQVLDVYSVNRVHIAKQEGTFLRKDVLFSRFAEKSEKQG